MSIATPPRTVPARLETYDVRRRHAVYHFLAAECARLGLRRVLDATAGDGFGAMVLAHAGLEVVAFDEDPMPLAASRRPTSGNPRYRVGDAARLPEMSGSYDAVVCVGGVEHRSEPRPLLSELRRLARAGGLVAVVTPNRLVHSPGRARPMDPVRAAEYSSEELFRMMSRRFGDVTMAGVHHGVRLRAVDRVLGTSIASTLKLVPAPDRTLWLQTALRGLGSGSFRVSPDGLRTAVDVIALARV